MSKIDMSIVDIPTDLIIHIAHFLPYAKCTLLLTLFKDIKPSHETFKWLFSNSELMCDILIQDGLKFHNISMDNFYDILKTQSIKVHQVFQVLNAVCKNSITTHNKKCFNLTYDSTYVTPIKLKHTTKVIQIMLTVIDHYAQDETKIINNPYHYVHMYVNDTLFNYFVDVVAHKFGTNNIRDLNSIQAFKYTIQVNYWYKSNINLYLIFCLYLTNLGIIKYKYTEVMMNLVSTIPTVCNYEPASDSILTFIFEFMQLFSANQWLAMLFTTAISYISTRKIQLQNDYQKDACLYVYNAILDTNDIKYDIIQNLTYVMQSVTECNRV